MRDCLKCGGSGTWGGFTGQCNTCSGRGYTSKGTYSHYKCTHCRGTGRFTYPVERCPNCGGTGKVSSGGGMTVDPERMKGPNEAREVLSDPERIPREERLRRETNERLIREEAEARRHREEREEQERLRREAAERLRREEADRRRRAEEERIRREAEARSSQSYSRASYDRSRIERSRSRPTGSVQKTYSRRKVPHVLLGALGIIAIVALVIGGLSVWESSQSATTSFGQYYSAGSVDINIVTMERVPELLYRTIDPQQQANHYRITPSKEDMELVLMQINVRNYDATSAIVNIDEQAAELQDLLGRQYFPININGRVEEVDAPANSAVERSILFLGNQTFEDGTTKPFELRRGDIIGGYMAD